MSTEIDIVKARHVQTAVRLVVVVLVPPDGSHKHLAFQAWVLDTHLVVVEALRNPHNRLGSEVEDCCSHMELPVAGEHHNSVERHSFLVVDHKTVEEDIVDNFAVRHIVAGEDILTAAGSCGEVQRHNYFDLGTRKTWSLVSMEKVRGRYEVAIESQRLDREVDGDNRGDDDKTAKWKTCEDMSGCRVFCRSAR